jgi:hypothetical protein
LSQAGLRKLLWRKLALLGATGEGGLSPSLAATFAHFQAISRGAHALTCELINTIGNKEEAPRAILELSARHRVPPTTLLRNADLPSVLPAVRSALNLATQTWISRRTKPEFTGGTWLVGCLEEMTREEQVRAVEVLAQAMSRDEAAKHQPLMNWVRANFSRRYDAGSLWSYLSTPGRNALREWVGAVNYRLLEQLVGSLLSHPQSSTLFSPTETNQLRKRVQFWSNYSHRFIQLRILLSRTAAEHLATDVVDGGEVAILDSQDLRPGSEVTKETDVCIFDFDEWLVIEFFRGPASESMLIPADDACRAYLFETRVLSVKRLRAFAYNLGTVVMDHCYGWQNESVRLLDEMGIYPNEGLRAFRIEPTHSKQYIRGQGIGQLGWEATDKRNSSLHWWTRDVANLKREALAAYPTLGKKSNGVQTEATGVVSASVGQTAGPTSRQQTPRSKPVTPVAQDASKEPENNWLWFLSQNSISNLPPKT